MRTPRLSITLLLAALALALFAGSALAAYNDAKVKNKSFEKDNNGDGIPNAWSPLVLNAGSQRVCNQAKGGNCSFKMKADGTTSFLLQETLNSSGPSGVTATISGWMKGKDLLGVGVSSIGVQFNYTGGGGFACGAQAAGGTFGWTWFEADCVAAQSFDSMTVQLFTNESSGKVWFDKVKLTAVGP